MSFATKSFTAQVAVLQLPKTSQREKESEEMQRTAAAESIWGSHVVSYVIL